MSSTTYSEFEDWLPRPVALGLALALWITGFTVAGAAAWRLGHTARASTPRLVAITATTTQAPSNTTTSGAVIVIPEDVVVGHRTPREGVTMKQKP